MAYMYSEDRNRRLFDDTQNPTEVIIEMIKETEKDWNTCIKNEEKKNSEAP